MAEEDDSQKTEEPTQRKLSKARQKGNVAQSQEIKHWMILMGGAIALMMLVPWTMKRVAMAGLRFIASPDEIPVDPGHLRLLIAQVALDTFIALLPILLLMIIFALAANLGQVGLLWAPDKIKPDLSKLSPLKGVKKLISIKQTVEFLKGLLKISVVGVVAFSLAIPMLADVTLVPDTDLIYTLHRMQTIILWLVAGTITVPDRKSTRLNSSH